MQDLSNRKNILELRCVSKAYPGVQALDNVFLRVGEGTVHALLGENGAGKSTLIKVISGAIRPDSGSIFFDGREYEALEPRQAMDMGISVIYQEFNLIPYLTVANNIFLGHEPGARGVIDEKTCELKTRELLSSLDIDIDPRAQVKTLSVGYQQLVEIVKAVSHNVKLLVMDEPTAALSDREVEKLFALVKKLREKGVAIVYISHRLEELFELADEVTVMRDGRYIKTLTMASCTRPELIELMVGREMAENYPQGAYATDEVVLEARDLVNEKLGGVSFQLRRGEVLGFAGLVGSGRTEVARAIFGADPLYGGTICIRGQEVQIRRPKDAVSHGIALLTEDRKQQGLLMKLSMRENITISFLDRILRRGMHIDAKRDRAAAEKYCNQLNIKTPSTEQLVKNLSGGNQQKVVLARWLLTNSSIVIFDEPTRGIDVGVKYEIYEIIKDLARNGISVIMISSELPELIGVSDRILVMHEGRLSGELKKGEANQQAVMALATMSGKQSGRKEHLA